MKHEELVDGEYQLAHPENETCDTCRPYAEAFPDGWRANQPELKPGVLRRDRPTPMTVG